MCIFHIILVGIPSSLILFVIQPSRGGGEGEYLTDKIASTTKQVTSKKVSSQAKVKDFSIPYSFFLFSRYSNFGFWTAFWFTESVMLLWVLVSIWWDRVHLFLNISFEPQRIRYQTWPVDRYDRGQCFSGIF